MGEDFMHEELLALIDSQVGAVQDALRSRNVETVYFTACGGSLATLYPGKYLIGRNTQKVNADIINAAEFAADPPVRLNGQSLVVLNSQSGGTPETLAAAALARARGAMTVAFTAAEDGKLGRAADHVIRYFDRPEDPYPAVLSIFPDVYKLTWALLDVWNGTSLLPLVREAMLRLQDTFDRVLDAHRACAAEFGKTHAREPLIYAVGAGLDYCAAYILANCEVMESVWKHSSAIHAGELFHGALEALERDTPVLALAGLGGCRSLEERAIRYLRRKTDRLTVLDAAEFPLEAYPDFLRGPVAMLVLNRLKAYYCEQIAAEMGKPMAERRYMGKEEY